MKNYLIIPESKKQYVLEQLISSFGLPTIFHDLSFYLETSNNNLLHLSFTNNSCSFRYINDDNSKNQTNGLIELKNKNLKHFLLFLREVKCDSGNGNETIRLNFYDSDYQWRFQLLLNSFHGIMLISRDEKDRRILENISKTSESKILDSLEIKLMGKNLNFERQTLFNEFGFINYKINSFAKVFGLDLKLHTMSLRDRIATVSNDYLIYEEIYKSLTGQHLISSHQINRDFQIKNISIIIPNYNSNKTTLKTLLSIQSQDLKIDEMEKVEVIVVDDGSDERFKDYLSKTKIEFIFKLKIIRHEKNLGLSAARNTGYNLAKNENIIFLDSDILLSRNYIREMATRMETIPNAAFFSLKENIDSSSLLTNDDTIKKGLPKPPKFNDKRILRSLTKDQLGYNSIERDTVIEIMNDTNRLTDFGFGRVMGGYDLPSMVVGHNMALKKHIINSVHGFSNYFTGWGLEDTYFGAKIIAEGNFVIPVLSTGVYHINHPPRSGSEEQQKKEFTKNINTYNKLLDQDYDEF